MRQKIRKKMILVVAAVLVAVLAVLYFAVSFYYRNHFYKGTLINGIDVTNNTLEEVRSIIQSQTDGYKLTLSTRDGGEETIEGEAIDLSPIWDGSIDAILESQNGFAWILKAANPDVYTSRTIIGYDTGKLKSVLESFDFMKPENQKQPVDASISDYIEGTGYELVPSEPGTAIDEVTLLAAVEAALDGLSDTLSVEDTGCYVQPAVLDDDEDLNRQLGILQKYCEAKITYTVGDDVFDLDADTYHDWFIIADDGSVTIDEEQARAYVVSLGHKYNTCYSTRDFKTSYGETVQITESDYGWKVDYDTETAQVIDEISSQTVTTRDLNYLMTAASHSSPDYGDSYVEINITAQHLFLYKDGELVVETDFVSGNVSAGNGTPSGIFGLTYKQRDATLRGATYESHVDYWMPFNGNIGMHDASWRSKFGAAIYLRSGSHGCINLPTSVAPTIYDTIDTNYPVIVYELPGSESEKGKAQIAAYSVIDLIKAIGDVTLDSADAITEARTAYDALSDTGKGYVTNTDTLTDAEKALKELQDKEAESASKKDKTDKKSNKKNKTDTSGTDSSSGKNKTDKTDTQDNEGANES
jgi:hypothetical protein